MQITTFTAIIYHINSYVIYLRAIFATSGRRGNTLLLYFILSIFQVLKYQSVNIIRIYVRYVASIYTYIYDMKTRI